MNDIVVPYKGEPTGTYLPSPIYDKILKRRDLGFHATSSETFASAIHTVFSLSPIEEKAMRDRARSWAVERFSRTGFEEAWESTGWRNWLHRP